LFLWEPKRYETIGLVSASCDTGWTEQQRVDRVVAELKRQAAKLGANGVILVNVAEKTTTSVGSAWSVAGTAYFYGIPVQKKTVSGKAIWVIEE